MITPTRRIMLYQPELSGADLEVVVLGDPEALAPTMAWMRLALEIAPGISRVRPLVMGSQMLGFRVTCEAVNPIADVGLALRGLNATWQVTHGGGLVGTW